MYFIMLLWETKESFHRKESEYPYVFPDRKQNTVNIAGVLSDVVNRGSSFSLYGFFDKYM